MGERPHPDAPAGGDAPRPRPPTPADDRTAVGARTPATVADGFLTGRSGRGRPPYPPGRGRLSQSADAAPGPSRPIRRARLAGPLNRGARLVTVVAGAGAGKSCLLAEWAATRDRVIRYTVRPEDAALPVFLRGLAEAAAGAGLPMPVEVAALGGVPMSPGGESGAEAVRAEGIAAVVAATLDGCAAAPPATAPSAAARPAAAPPATARPAVGAPPAAAGVPPVTSAPPAAGVPPVTGAPSAPAGARPGPVGRHAGGPITVLVDDLHELPPDSASVRLVEALCRHAPAGLRLVLTSRQPLPFPVERLRAAGHLAELGVDDLVFAEDETYRVLAAVLGDAAGADALAPDLHLLTGGWPALVALGAGWLAQYPAPERPARLGALGGAVGPLGEYLAGTLLAGEEPEVRRLVRAAAHLPALDARLAAALDLPAPRRHPPFLEESGDGRYAVPAGLRGVVGERAPLPEQELRRLREAAVRWHLTEGSAAEGLALATALGDPALTARLLSTRGGELITGGRAAEVVAAAAAVPANLRDDALELAEAEARHVRGDLAGALACFERLARGRTTLPAGIAYRMGNIHHLAGDLDAAMAAYQRGELGHEDGADQAVLLSRIASVHWLRGDDIACAGLARRSLAAARRCDDDRALAAAHAAMALVTERSGDWPGHAHHTGEGLAAAARAGDLLAQLRGRIGRSQRLLEEARFAAGLTELDEAARLVEASGAAEWRALVHVNRGWAYRGLGRLDEAIAELEAAARGWRAAGSALVSYALVGLGSVYLLRGDLAEAERVLCEADELGRRTGDAQALAALATLSRVRFATDPASAREVADRSLETNTGLWRVWALLSAGWVALNSGDRAGALRYADLAAEMVARRNDLSARAEECELRALAAELDLSERLRLVQEAQVRWAALGNPICVARTLVVRARLVGDPAGAAAAEARLRALGVRPEVARAAGPLRTVGAFAGVAPARATLDTFLEVVRDGVDRFARGERASATRLLADAVETRPEGHGARPGYLAALRTLAAAESEQGAPEAALRWWLRLLEHDPDDETGHLGAVAALARAGRHDEARHRYARYVARMRELGTEPAPYPRAGVA